ncbi:unnamed protein product [Arabidopsis halleri]
MSRILVKALLEPAVESIDEEFVFVTLELMIVFTEQLSIISRDFNHFLHFSKSLIHLHHKR